MPTDTYRIECTLDNDAWLMAGFGAIAYNGAAHAGLSEVEQEDFVAAAMKACREAFAQVEREGSRDSALHIAVAAFPGRVEATIEYAALAPGGGGRESACQCSADRGGLRSSNLPHAPGAQYETRDGRCRVTLAKNCGEVKARTRD